MNNKRLAMYIICCHVDKPMDEGDLKSCFNVPIQAGAALTDKRICELNDYDGFPESISDRNKRYSEMTAMYYIGKHIETEYVGLAHYRRRFLLSDDELNNYMDKGFDIITTKSYPLPEIISENYRVSLYSKDWDLFLEILGKYAPGDIELANEVFSKDYIHPCNMNIFKDEVYKEYCDYVFPILDEFYKRSPWKKDVYQRRDVGFIGERISSLFVEKKIREGKKVIEAPFRDLRTKGWSPQDECDLKDYDAVYGACKKFYSMEDITKCRLMIAESVKNGGIEDKRIRTLLYLFRAGVKEQKEYTKTLFEYLPEAYKKDLDTLYNVFDGVGMLVKILSSGITTEGMGMYNEFMHATGFSEIVFKIRCEMESVSPGLYEIVNGKQPVLVIMPEDICYGSLKYIALCVGKSLKRKGETVYYSDKENLELLLKTIGNRWKYIIGIQARGLNTDYFKNLNNVPKIQIIMDSTYFVPDLFTVSDENYYYFCHDINYVEFVKNQYGHKNVFEFVPGYDAKNKEIYPKEYDVTFIGTYKHPINPVERWDDSEARSLYEYVIGNPDKNYEECIKLFYEENGDRLNDSEIGELLWKQRDVLFSACDYYRDKIIKAILQSGIKLHVYGDTWREYDSECSDRLIIHDEIEADKAITEMKKSKISLNIMSWHKAGVTERVVNIMGSGAVLVTDETSGIKKLFNSDSDSRDQELVTFTMNNIEKLPIIIKELLNDDNRRELISERAKDRILNNYTWDDMTDKMIATL